MLIDDLLIEMPVKFQLSESTEDKFVLKVNNDANIGDWDLDYNHDERDCILVEKFGTFDTPLFDLIRAYRTEVLKVPNDQSINVQIKDDSPEYSYFLCCYKVDYQNEDCSKYIFLKGAKSDTYAYVATAFIHKPYKPKNKLSMRDVLVWPPILRDNFSADPEEWSYAGKTK